MHVLKTVLCLLISIVMLSLSGCGGGSGDKASTVNDPLAPASSSTTGNIFGNISSATGKTGITLTTDRASVDANNGQVLVTANVVNNGAGVSGVPVTFSIVAPINGPATVEDGMTTVKTNANGEAITRITTGNTLSTTNVIVAATAAIGKQTATANTTFQIVRGGGVIMFTDKAGLPAGEQSNILTPGSAEVYPAISSEWSFKQLIPFKVTDSNGNPRAGVPVTLSVYSITNPGIVKIDFLVDPVTEPNQKTITTDSAGQGIFNVAVTMTTPTPGKTNIVDVVFKAVTNDAAPVTAYVGNMYTLTSKVPALTIAPTSTSFAAGDAAGATRTFLVSGGTAPYAVNSDNSGKVSATISGSAVTATLLDTALWTDTVTISVSDSSGQTASATIKRQ